MARKKVDEPKIKVGNITDVRGEVNIATGDIYKGFTVAQVSVLIKQIKTSFQPKKFDGHCPYKGLDVFEEEDAELFFGREKLVDDLVNRVRESKTVYITGPSGSGKSSLVRAGLIYALKKGSIKNSDHWLYETIKPGRDPIESLALAFSRLKSPELANYFRGHVDEANILHECAESALSNRKDQWLVLFIDQFEEVFTQVGKDKAETFINILTNAAAVENGRIVILFAMRSDFVSNCATYPQLNNLLNQQFIQVGAMQPNELVSAIAQPALRVGLRVDPDLIAQVINDMEGEPGTLPLMQFALKDLFNAEQEKGALIALTLTSYHARGGIHKSLERHADGAFTTLSTDEQELARSIFSSLIEIGHDTPDTSRTALFDELVPATAKPADVQAIVRKLADARLITTDEQAGKDLVTISHERLINAWPWLRKLVNENRDVIALQNEIAGDAEEWDTHQRDTSYLYTGARLANAREKLNANKLVLNGLSQAFLEAGIKAHTDELEAVRQRAGQLRKRALYLTGALITALVAGGVAIYLGLTAFTRQLAAQATVLQTDKIDLAMLMSIYAHNLNDDFETRSSLLSSLQCCSDELIAFMNGHEDSVWDVAFSPDGKTLASAGNDGMIILWDVKSRELSLRIRPASSAPIYTLAFSPTDPILATGDGTGSIILYNTQTWKPITTLLHGSHSNVLSIKFSKDGRWLLSGGTDGKVILWDVVTGKPSRIFTDPKNWVWDVAISADNKTVAAVARINKPDYKALYLWSLTSDASTNSKFTTPQGIPVSFVSVAFNDNPSSRILLTGDTGGNVVVWDLAPWRNNHKEPTPSLRLPTGPGATSNVWGLAFIPGNDHNLEFVTGRDRGIMNRNLILLSNDPSKTTLQRESLGMTGNNFGFFRIDLSPDGKLVAAAGQDGLVSLWRASESSSVIRHSAKVTNMQMLNDGSTVAMSVDANGGLYRWDYWEQKILQKLSLGDNPVMNSAISADGTKVVTGLKDGTIILWNGKYGKKLSEYTDHQAPITSLAFRSDGKQLASSDNTGNVILWKVTSNALERSDHFTDPQGSAVQILLFSNDGKTLVGGGCRHPIIFPSPDCSQGTTYVWNTQLKFSDQDRRLQGKAGFVWSLAFNPANTDELAIGTVNGAVTVWDLHEGHPRLELRLSEGAITSLAFSPDGKLLAVGANSYTVSIFDSETGQRFGQSFREHDGPVIGLAFIPDGNTLLSASSDNTVVIHSMNPTAWEANACRISNRNLQPEEWNIYFSDKLPYQRICPEPQIELEKTSTP